MLHAESQGSASHGDKHGVEGVQGDGCLADTGPESMPVTQRDVVIWPGGTHKMAEEEEEACRGVRGSGGGSYYWSRRGKRDAGLRKWPANGLNVWASFAL